MKKLFSNTACALLVGLFLSVAVGCGGKTSPPTQTPTPTNPTKAAAPLDPQGNWLFNINGSPDSFSLGGQLFELNIPVVTSNLLGPVGPDLCNGSFTMSGQASGVNSITLTAQQVNSTQIPIALTLTGTIADDQAHMSGTWSIKTPGSCLLSTEGSGTWDAQLLVNVTGSWSGTFSDEHSDLLVTAALTENVDQTSLDMGKITGTVTVLGSPCFPNSDTLTLNPATLPDLHIGETLLLNPIADENGVTISTIGSVTTDGTSYTSLVFSVKGGECDGKILQGTLAKQ